IRRGDLSHEESEADILIESAESSRVLDQVIVCVDADAFFCSVEERYDPSLRGKAFAVAAGVLTTASYEARKYVSRISSFFFFFFFFLDFSGDNGMASYIAKKLCPHLLMIKPNFTRYSTASDSMMNVLRRFDQNLSPVSFDECFLNVTSYCTESKMSPGDLVSLIRKEVLDITGLTVSAGIGPNSMIAKIAADLKKPNGQYECPSTRLDSMKFMENLPVRKVPGIGRVTERWLEAVGVKICGDVWKFRGKLYLMKSEASFDLLIRAYLGIGKTEIRPSARQSRQSVGCETSFQGTSSRLELFGKLEKLSQELAEDLAQQGFSGRTLTLKVKLDTFEVLSRSITRQSIYSAEDLLKFSSALLEREIVNRQMSYDRGETVQGCGGNRELTVRLLGLKVRNRLFPHPLLHILINICQSKGYAP
ncbi:expressed protein, partial [Phakopsora pachyrhizi]